MDGSKCRSRRRGRRRREDTPLDDDDLGEGCSYLVHSPYTQIGCPSGLQDSSTEGRSNHRQVRRSKHTACTCTPSPSSIPRAAAILLAAAAAAVSHASASPVEVKVMSSSSRVNKGKQRAYSDDTVHGLDCSHDTQSSTLDCITPLRIPPDSDEAQSLLFDANARGSSQALHHRNKHLKRSNTPDGVPSHYEYIDGEWVPSSDWSLNGLDGNRHASSLSGAGGSAGNGDSDGQSNSEDSTDAGTGGPSTRQNNASPTAANEGDIPDDNALASTTLGWAKSTNAILGVDIDTSLSGSIGTATRSTSSATSSMITRTNMATYTPISSSSPAIPVASSSSTSTSSRTSNNNNNGQAYDFSRDVPNGWVSDGRTAAYAVPVIIGLSIFLACIIFSLILVLLRMNKSRKRRRKAVLNGKLKLSEEGKLPPTRPTSPVLSQQDGGDNDTDEGVRGISSSVNRRRSSGDGERHSIEGEEEKHAARRRIGRKWTPSLNNGALRKRRKRIAQLFKSNGNEPVKEIIVIDGQEEQAQDTTQNILRRRTSISTISSSAAASVASREQNQETLSRVVSNTSIRSATRQNSNEDRAYIRPPSLRVDTSDSLSSTHPPGRASALTSPAHSATSPHTQLHEETQNQRQYHARHDSIDASDHHAVPVPSVGPPAYMQPSTPAYTRSVAGPSSSSSSAAAAAAGAGGLTAAIHTSGYMSAVSTPGLSAGLDEKRALLGIAEGSGGTIDANDAFASQRRYEHLYNSREGEEARIEQMTGAPSFSSPSSSSTIFNTSTSRTLPLSTVTTCSSSRFGMNGYNRYEDVGTAEENDEAFARRTQIEAIEEHRRELQASLAGHVAISDKETLGRLRMLGSAPIIPSTSSPPSAEDDEEQAANAEASPSVSVPPSTRRGRHMLEASAPSLDEAEEEVLQAYLASQPEQASSQQQEITSSNSVQQSSMLLPAPPRPISSSRQALDLIPQVDEKTRLRQAEERIAASSFSPIFTSFNQEEEDQPQMVPSAPPAMDNSSVYEASTPSAPVLEGDINEENQVEYIPSAPPLEELTIHHPSVPSYVVEDEEEEGGEHDSENRPYNEGVI